MPPLIKIFLLFSLLGLPSQLWPQSFYFGADLSYVNEMENCGAVYYDGGEVKDPYQIFAENSCNLVRLRLWHTPSWYDTLNSGQRYSDLNDVKKSIRRAKTAGMQVLLDFHLSDTWADPANQLIPKAWQEVAKDLPSLSDSLFFYIKNTLLDLHQSDLLPEMVQIGNETNKEILLTPEENDQPRAIDWNRNAALFNSAIQAVREVEEQVDSKIDIILHISGPASASWYIENFISQEVTDFDIIGLSYYWQWHFETDLEEFGEIMASLRGSFPQYQVMIVETAYPWTNDYKDSAGNILSRTHPDFQPLSPENQLDFMISLTRKVMDNDGIGVIYWEPAWISTSCSTPWGKGSHFEQATFFDFQNHLLLNGGIKWMSFPYQTTSVVLNDKKEARFKTFLTNNGRILHLKSEAFWEGALLKVYFLHGAKIFQNNIRSGHEVFYLPELPAGIYILTMEKREFFRSEKIIVIN